ncbi:MAG TPA: PfkB family carbohydrate kinase [Alphaproteobacteria bacterium]|nr:PfkB family carbohydrate kinase [Alphaproteobacteria bacterium]
MLPKLAGEYRRKVKTIDEVCAAVGARPRQRPVIMCHGVFDLIHPGHVRHLVYAKEKADILVASLTADIHITKAEYRPFVPQDLRALNLAALEMVDYVVIDPNPTPLEHIARLQPDFFAKGYEYVNGRINPKTQQELDVLRSYGGEIVFTPGDIVYSSSHLIETVPPDLSIEKLLLLMEAERLTFAGLRGTLNTFEGVEVHVVGDTIVDSLTYTTMIGGMTKTPTPSVRFDQRRDFIGGAAVVAEHLSAAGAKVTLSTVLGDDPLGQFVVDGLTRIGVKVLPIVDHGRPTCHKNAIVCGEYRLLKIDTLDNGSVSDDQAQKLADQIHDVNARAVVFSDFRHGIFNGRTIQRLIKAIPAQTYRVADSQVASRWGNVMDFRGFDLLTPNEREARFALADQDTGIRPLAARLLQESDCKTLILKLGERGVLTCRGRAPEDPRNFFVVDSFAANVVDAVGAGDALLAYATLTLVTAGSEAAASILGSMAAALECEADGNIPIGRADVLNKITAVEKQAHFV